MGFSINLLTLLGLTAIGMVDDAIVGGEWASMAVHLLKSCVKAMGNQPTYCGGA
jgi:multidrug efflux pump subunit AcrB